MNRIRALALTIAFGLTGLHSITTVQAHELRFGNLVISHPWSRQSPMSPTVAAGFFNITNTGTQDDRLVKVSAEITPIVQLHDMKMDGDVMKMQEVPEGIVIPAGSTIDLKPGSFHVMFMGLKAPVMVGEQIKATLTFEKAGRLDVSFEVLNPDAGMN